MLTRTQGKAENMNGSAWFSKVYKSHLILLNSLSISLSLPLSLCQNHKNNHTQPTHHPRLLQKRAENIPHTPHTLKKKNSVPSQNEPLPSSPQSNQIKDPEQQIQQGYVFPSSTNPMLCWRFNEEPQSGKLQCSRWRLGMRDMKGLGVWCVGGERGRGREIFLKRQVE